MHKNTNKQNKYLFIHSEYPSPHKTADDQFHFDQWTFVHVSLSWQIDQGQSQGKSYIHSVGHKIYTVTGSNSAHDAIIEHNVEEKMIHVKLLWTGIATRQQNKIRSGRTNFVPSQNFTWTDQWPVRIVNRRNAQLLISWQLQGIYHIPPVCIKHPEHPPTNSDICQSVCQSHLEWKYEIFNVLN